MKVSARWFMGLIVAATLSLGASEAFAARSAIMSADCPEPGNWCALSRGGLQNCYDCCGSEQSICNSFDEDPPTRPSQGCICGS